MSAIDRNAMHRPLAFAGGEHEQAFVTPSSGVAPNGLPYFSWSEAAAQLNREGWSWSTTLGTPIAVTYAFRATGPVPNFNGVSGFAQFNAIQIAVAEELLTLWSEVANVTFTRVGGSGYSDNATILFGNFINGPSQFSAFTYLPEPDGTASSQSNGDMWFNVSRDYDADPQTFPLGAQIMLHEIGHALGLLHPSEYGGGAGGGATYSNDADFWQDTRQFTTMTYFNESFTGGSYGQHYVTAPQMFDIAAAQYLYGANTTTRTGDTVYGFNSNAGHDVFSIASSAEGAIFCIWDAGGDDTLDLSGYSTNSEIDLRPQAFSSAGSHNSGAMIGNISIARDVVIENAIGGSGNDTLTGNAAANRLDGGSGNDTIIGGAAADILIGGSGSDTAGYATATGGVVAHLDAVASNTGDAQGDTYTSIENLLGSDHNDMLGGDDGDNRIEGGAGADTLEGGLGANQLHGGADNDIYLVSSLSDLVTENANEGADTVRLAIAGIYALRDNVENLVFIGAGAAELIGNALANTLTGGDGADKLYGYGGADALDGGAGADTLEGGAGGDAFMGGGGTDTVSYSRATDAGVEVNLTLNRGIGGEAQGDTFSGIETLVGTSFGDLLTGTNDNNFIYGLAGDDRLWGNGGNDILIGAAGADILTGGAGIDATSYHNSTTGVRVVLFQYQGFNGEAQGDRFGSIENIIGSPFADEIFGDNANNELHGQQGADNLYGNTGNDLLEGGTENDNLQGQDGNDTLSGGAGADQLIGGNGADSFYYRTASESASGARDQIVDFTRAHGDKVNLAGIDANTAAGGDQAFGFIGSAAFSGVAGQLRFSANLLEGDVNGDGAADFQIEVNIASMLASDFWL